MKQQKSPAATEQNNINKTKYIIRKWDEKVKHTYEMIDILEQAKTTTKNQLLCLIQEVREEIGKAVLLNKLNLIYEERFEK